VLSGDDEVGRGQAEAGMCTGGAIYPEEFKSPAEHIGK